MGVGAAQQSLDLLAAKGLAAVLQAAPGPAYNGSDLNDQYASLQASQRTINL